MRMVFVCVVIAALSGCSATSALTGLVGSKPEITAQAGAENTKQMLGVNAKQDASTNQETSVKDSHVGAMDTSSKKHVSTSSIKADNITAERIEIRNNDPINVTTVLVCIAMFAIGMFAGWLTFRNKKGA